MLMPPPAPAVTASPAPSATPRELKTIVTVSTSPYCTALVEHFNGALLPMVANDRLLDATSITLDDFNGIWNANDYVGEFYRTRDRMGKEINTLEGSLDTMQHEIDALRAGAKFAESPDAAKAMVDASHQLQLVYDQQQNIATMLTGLHDNMMRYNVQTAPLPQQGFNMQLALAPQSQKDVKEYLHWTRRRGAIDWSEDQAVGDAIDIAEKRCGAK